MEIDDKINDIQWLNAQGSNLFILTTNDRTVKLWKIYSTTKKDFKAMNKNTRTIQELEVPRVKTGGKDWKNVLKRSFPNLHTYHINSISCDFVD